ncbi:hypothetical protein FKM82_019314 [Ascaphus truei]
MLVWESADDRVEALPGLVRSSPVIGLELRCAEISEDRWRSARDLVLSCQRTDSCLDLWIRFQEKWIFLSRASHELELCLPSVDMFQAIDCSYRSFVDVTSRDPRILSLLSPPHGESLCSVLRGGIRVMDRMIGDLGWLLDSSRALCSRLFFLSDQDLLSILAACSEPAERTPCALLCFPCITDVLFQAHPPDTATFPLYNSPALTVGVVGECGEQLYLSSPVGGHVNTISWLSELEQGLRGSLRDQLALCLCERRAGVHRDLTYTHNPPLWAAQGTAFPWQCLAVCEEVLWCEDMEENLFTHRRAALRDRHRHKLQVLGQSLRDLRTAQSIPSPTSRLAQTVLSAWITLIALQRDRTHSLLDGGVQTPTSFPWAKILKYKAETRPGYTEGEVREGRKEREGRVREKEEEREGRTRNGGKRGAEERTAIAEEIGEGRAEERSRTVEESIADEFEQKAPGDEEPHGRHSAAMAPPLTFYVDVLGYQLPYEYEYISLGGHLLGSALSDRATLGLILAMEQYQCGTVIGQDSSTRTQTVLALGNALGRQVVVLKCLAGMELGLLKQHLRGALQGGAWLVLDSAHRLNVEVQSSLGQILWDIQSSCKALIQPGPPTGIARTVPGPGAGHYQPSMIGSIQFEGRTVSVGKSYGCFFTLPHLDSSCTLPSNLRLLLRPVSLLPTDLRWAAELALLAAGFHEHSSLATKISCFFRMAEESGAVPLASCPPLIRNVVHRAVFFLETSFTHTENMNALEVSDLETSEALCTEEERVHVRQTSHHPVGPLLITRTLNIDLEERALFRALCSSPLLSGPTSPELGDLKDILRGVFPMCTSPLLCTAHFVRLCTAMKMELQESGLEAHAELISCALQLYQAIQQSPGVLLTGPPGSGKTTCWKILAQALNRLAGSGELQRAEGDLQDSSGDMYHPVGIMRLFPNSLTPQEVLGEKEGGSWKDGVLSQCLHWAAQKSVANKWLVLDGPATPEWTEPVSCLFGASPVLTLPSGQRLQLPESVTLLFEMPDTSGLTPALVTLCRLVHCGGVDTWKAVLGAFISTVYKRYRVTQSTVHLLQSLSENLIPSMLCFLEQHCTLALHPHTAPSAHTARGIQEVSSFCTILQALMDQHLLRDHIPGVTSEAQGPLGKAEGHPGETRSQKARTEGKRVTAKATAADRDGSRRNESGATASLDQLIPPQNHRLAQAYILYSFIWGFGGHLNIK